jgi:hypothetical protein
MSTLIQETHTEGNEQARDQRSLVAREGTELAEALRARGWQARAGWRRVDGDGEPIWFVRFEQPTQERR